MERALVTTTRVLIGLVLLTPLVVMSDPLPRTFFPFVVGKALYARTMIELALLAWVLLAIRSPAYRLPRSRLAGLVGLYLLAMVLATVVSVSPQRSLWSNYERMMGLFDTAHWLLLIVLVAAMFRSWAQWRVLLNVNLAVGTTMALLGLSERFAFGPVIDTFSFLAGPQGASSARLGITLGNPTYVGAYFLVNSIIAVGMLGYSYLRPRDSSAPRAVGRRRRQSRRAEADSVVSTEVLLRVFWALATVLGFTMILLSGTRGALFGLTGAVACFAVSYMLWGRLPLIKYACAGVAVLGLVLAGGLTLGRDTPAVESLAKRSVMVDRITRIGPNDASIRGRLDSTRLGLRGVAARPLTGWGPENFTVAYDRYLTPEIVGNAAASFDQAHNKLVEELTTKGAIGFLAYMAIWVYGALVLVRRARAQATHEQLFTLVVGAALAGYFAQNLFLFDTPGTIVQFILLVAFVTYLDSPHGAPEEQPGLTGRLASLPGYAYWRLLLADDGDPALRADAPARQMRDRRPRRIADEEVATSYLVTAGILAAVMVAFIFLTSVRPYVAAQAASAALQPDNTWREKLELLDDALDAFPPLANHPILFQHRFGTLISNLGDLREGEIGPALTAAQQVGDAALERNPREWRIMLIYAQLHQRVLPAVPTPDPTLIVRSRELINSAVQHAPARIEVQLANAAQHLFEGNPEGAKRAIDKYLESNPKARDAFALLQRQVDAAMGQ